MNDMEKLNNKNKPPQVHTIVLTGKNFPMDASDITEYVYISIDLNQSLMKVLSNKLDETWIELGVDKSPKEIIESDEFIKNLKEDNIYYMDDKYMDFQKSYIFASYIK